MWDQVSVEVSVYSDQFTNNNITLYYIKELEMQMSNEADAPANNPIDLFFNVQGSDDEINKIKHHSDPMCRFVSSDGKRVAYT
jgi:hypothetical protein